MVNIKETVYIWVAIVGVAAGCAFSYGASSIIFDAVEGGEGADSAAAVIAVASRRTIERNPQAILAEIAAAEARVVVAQNELAGVQAKLVALRAELADFKTVSVEYNSSVTDDRASYNRFSPGTAQQSASKNDLAFTVNLNNYSDVTITKMTVIHSVTKEGWSTSNSEANDLNRKLYPLVVDREAQEGSKTVFKQVNTEYNQSLGLYKAVVGNKPNVLRVYGQPEKVPFVGGVLYIEYADGKTSKISIKGVTGTPQVPQSDPVTVTPISSSAIITR